MPRSTSTIRIEVDQFLQSITMSLVEDNNQRDLFSLKYYSLLANTGWDNRKPCNMCIACEFGSSH